MMKNRKGFTLIELLIVVVIIGILAAIAIPKFGATRDKAYISQMKSDLRNLQSAQELFYSSGDFKYANAISELGDSFSFSKGVEIGEISGDQTGWSATVTHEAKPQHGNAEITCAVYVGSVEAPEGAPDNLPAGVVGCTNESFDEPNP